ncbi:hypothetical protein Hanom_Chr16g01436801 [Helianthus anomalus]
MVTTLPQIRRRCMQNLEREFEKLSTAILVIEHRRLRPATSSSSSGHYRPSFSLKFVLVVFGCTVSAPGWW